MSETDTTGPVGGREKALEDALHEAVAMLEIDPEADEPGSDLYTWLRTTAPMALASAPPAPSTAEGELSGYAPYTPISVRSSTSPVPGPAGDLAGQGGILDALRALEAACDRRARLLSSGEYLKALDGITGMQEALEALDDARRRAREIIRTAPSPSPSHRIIEAADCIAVRGAAWALTIEWPDGAETLEHVSDHAARALGYHCDEGEDLPQDPAPRPAGDLAGLSERATGERVRHMKRGTDYEVLDRKARLQTDQPLTDDAEVVVYRSASGMTWVRPVSEMNDGRFVTLTPAAPHPEVTEEEIARKWWDRVCPRDWVGQWDRCKTYDSTIAKQLVAETYDDARAILALFRDADRGAKEGDR